MRTTKFIYTILVLNSCGYVRSFATPKVTHLKKTSLQVTNFAREPDDIKSTRRTFINALGIVTSSSFVGFQYEIANALSDEKPKEFIDMGTQAPAPDGQAEFVELQNGVKVKEFRSGAGTETVTANSSVQIQCSGKLLNLNGVSFYNTKNNNPDGFGALPLSIRLGQGEAIPGLESGIIGMRKGGIRRIIIPADLAYSKYPDLEPKPMNANDQRTLDSVVKNSRRDATIMFDVSVERIK